jgi:hypothetical protein
LLNTNQRLEDVFSADDKNVSREQTSRGTIRNQGRDDFPMLIAR